jgi:hypothetical protein
MISFGVNHHRAAREAYPNIVADRADYAINEPLHAAVSKVPPLLQAYLFTAPLANATYLRNNNLEHDPEKWIPVFGKDHAPPKG